MCHRAIIIKNGEVIRFMDLDGDSREKQITYVVESLDAENARNILRDNGYDVASREGQAVRIRIGTSEKKDVAKLLASHNVVLTGLYEDSETLEDTFLELMKE